MRSCDSLTYKDLFTSKDGSRIRSAVGQRQLPPHNQEVAIFRSGVPREEERHCVETDNGG